MKELELGIQDIKELMQAFQRGGMGKMKLRHGEFSLELESREGVAVAAAVAVAAQPAPVPEEELHSGEAVTSPIVGTFYAAPSPESEPFVQVGSNVKKGDVLFIIESMKLMNEVASDCDGVVTEIAVENGQGVEYGQPILYIG